jgi:hypothetical protein
LGSSSGAELFPEYFMLFKTHLMQFLRLKFIMQRMIWMDLGISSKLSYGNKLYLAVVHKN